MKKNKLISLDLYSEDEKKQMAVELLTTSSLKITLEDVAKMFEKGSGYSARKLQEGEEFISITSYIYRLQ